MDKICSDLNPSYSITYFVRGTGPPRAFKYYTISRVTYTRINTVAYAAMRSESNRIIVVTCAGTVGVTCDKVCDYCLIVRLFKSTIVLLDSLRVTT